MKAIIDIEAVEYYEYLLAEELVFLLPQLHSNVQLFLRIAARPIRPLEQVELEPPLRLIWSRNYRIPSNFFRTQIFSWITLHPAALSSGCVRT